MPHHGGPRGKCQGQSGGRGRSKGETYAGPLLWLLQEGMGKAGRQAEVTRDNFGGVCGTGAIPSYPWGSGMALPVLACI